MLKEHHYAWIMIYYFTICGIAQASFFDLDELEGFHYSINFNNDPRNEKMLMDIPPSNTISMEMRNSLGQHFQCLIPSPESLSSEKKITPLTPDISPNLMNDIMELLKPLKDHPCLKRLEGYWEYELCYGQYIKQYHTQDDKPVGDMIVLGNYDSGYTENEHNKNRLLRHHSQYYINGSVCDELGSTRKAEVRYICDPDTPTEFITNVEEPALCEYILTVKTSRTCTLSQMRPVPKSKEKFIDCFPLLTSSQFSRYMERESKKLKYSEGLMKSSERVLSALSDEQVSEKIVDEIVNLVQSSVTDSPSNSEFPSFTVINARKYLDEVVSSSSEDVDSDEKNKETDEDEKVPLKEDEDIENLINESSDLIKQLHSKYSAEELSKIMKKIEKGAKNELGEILKEVADDFNTHFKPLERAQAHDALSNSVDTLMSKIKSVIKDVDKGIQDMEKVIKDDDNLLQELEESLDSEEYDISGGPDIISNKDSGESESDLLSEKDSASKEDSLKSEDTNRKRSVKKDLSLQEEGYEGPPLSELDMDSGDRQSLDDILSSIQTKINKKMGSVRVKVVTSSELKDDDDLPTGDDEEDSKYYSRMMYESLVGNNKAYEDIKKYRRDRKGYFFSISSEEKFKKASENQGVTTQKGNLRKLPARLSSVIRNYLSSSKGGPKEVKKPVEHQKPNIIPNTPARGHREDL